jgi:hypothetical protein
MEGLAGDLGTMPIPDLLLYLGNRALTGTLVCEQGSVKKSVSLKSGEVINAASNDPREYLGQFLINFGHISEDQLTKAFQTQSETKVFLGRILVMIGLVTEEALRQVLAIKIRETTLSLCRWKTGNFRFARGVLPPEQEGISVQVPLLDIHREAEFRETAWEAMLQVFPHGGIALRVDEAKIPRDISPASLDGQLFELMREGHLIDEISLRLHATDFHLYQRLYALYRQGMIAPVESDKPEPEDSVDLEVEDETRVADILHHAREYIAASQFSEAESLAARAVEMDRSPEAQAVLKDAEAGLLDHLRADLLSDPKIPELAVPANRLRALDLSPQDRYLLSRIDGVRDLSAIIRVSPIREVDALKSFRKFVKESLIVLRPG